MQAADDLEAPLRRRLVDGDLVADYFTTQPASTQWVAVGVISGGPLNGARRLLVGTGRSEPHAIEALRRRLAYLAQVTAESPAGAEDQAAR